MGAYGYDMGARTLRDYDVEISSTFSKVARLTYIVDTRVTHTRGVDTRVTHG